MKMSLMILMVLFMTASSVVYADDGDGNDGMPNHWSATPFSGTSSAYKIPGFQKPEATTKVTSGNTHNVGILDEAGVNYLLEVDASLKMSIKGREYVFTILDADRRKAVFVFDYKRRVATKGDVDRTFGEKIDLDGDDEYDVVVLYHSLYPPTAEGKTGRFADMELHLNNDQVEEMAVTSPPKPKPQQQQVVQEPYQRKNKLVLVGLSILGVVVVLVFLWQAWYGQKKKNSIGKKNETKKL